MIFRPFKAEHLYAVKAQAAQAEALSFMRWPIAKAAQDLGEGWTGYSDDGALIGCAGFVPEEDHLLAWAVFSPLLERHALSIVRKVRAELKQREGTDVHAHVMAGHAKAARFAERLGFAFEREAENRHPSGASYVIFVRR